MRLASPAGGRRELTEQTEESVFTERERLMKLKENKDFSNRSQSFLWERIARGLKNVLLEERLCATYATSSELQLLVKMSSSEEDEAQASPCSRQSMKTDQNFRAEPEPSNTKGQLITHRVHSSASSCMSMNSDWSKNKNPNFKTEPSNSEGQLITHRVHSSASSCMSMNSDWSKDKNPNFKTEPSNSKQSNENTNCEEEQVSCCSLCQNALKDPVSTSCGHWFCRQCITSYWDQSDPSGLCSCPKCVERPRSRAGLQTSQSRTIQNVGLQEPLDEHQVSVKRRYENTTEGTDETGKGTPLNRIYTELYITEGLREEVNTHHEVKQLERVSKILHDVPIRCQDIFKALTDQHGSIRVVLTIGVAGIGKTFSVQKFTLDWAEGLENQDISAVVPLSFREMNLIRDEQHSLLTLIQRFHPTFQKIPAEQLSVWKILFIFDGLDESRLSLDFNNSQVVSDVTQKSSINVLLTNLIQGRLLPSALVWITSRPAAANQIPPSCVSRVTEVRGFTDSQKEEYFRRRFSDEDLSSRIISHIKASKSLFIMCGVPVFCWITAVVLENMLTTEQRGELPKTLTDMYSHFLMVQTKRKKNKYQQEHEENPQELTEADMEVLLKLGRLAFEHLEKGNIMFYQEDLEQCGLDVTEASLYSGVCTEIFRRECEIFQKPVYSFVHLSVQEFLAAVYMIHCYNNKKTEVVENFLGPLFKDGPDMASRPNSFFGRILNFFDVFNFFKKYNQCFLLLEEFLKRVMMKSLQSQTGHLDLFVRFLHGLTVESNQRVLGSLLGQTESSPETTQKMINNLREMNSDQSSPDRCINIFHCLVEMQDLAVCQEIQELWKPRNRSKKKLLEIHCSALAYLIQMSEGVVDTLNLNHYNMTYEGQRRLIPAVRNCRRFCFARRHLSETNWEVVVSALTSNPSHLIELDLSQTHLEDAVVKILYAGLESSNCILKTLRLKDCSLSETSCAILATALKSNPSHLTELDLSFNKNLQDSGVLHLCAFLGSSDCRMKALRLKNCSLSQISCDVLASALRSNSGCLRELDLGWNELQDSGCLHLCAFLQSPGCRLRTLSLQKYGLSEVSCAALVPALKSNPSHLKRLNLCSNSLEDSGVKHLCTLLESPHCRLRTLGLMNCSLSEVNCKVLASALKSNPFHLTELDLAQNELQDSGVLRLCGFLESPDCRLKALRLKICSLSEVSCEALASALKSNPSYLTDLELDGNELRDSGVLHLCGFLKSPDCRLKALGLGYCSLSRVSCDVLVSALRSNPSHLMQLDLTCNNLQQSDVQQLLELVQSPDFKLKNLRWTTDWTH
ncbi:NACHT, LRR and PYD domains-containing protein 14 isoform X2 [Oryzias latipes]|uniref:NACHT, LRR and PYD domains-containing protein 14 isoform X2 n=1 Tax=Oryzias latipes TaxID=8090 RepID=UPI000CE1D44C|nr:NACHT, LRR and PYD domains-containing protein 14 isoform X2 [Oryzias latipes]